MIPDRQSLVAILWCCVFVLSLVSWTVLPGNAAPQDEAPAPAPTRSWNVLDYGAVADETTDCTEAFQKALDACGEAGGGVVDVPAGRYVIRGNLRVPAHVTLQGTYRMPPTIHRPVAAEIRGTVLLAYAGRGTLDGEPFIRLAGSCAAVQGLVILYPEWSQTDVPPVPYPPCIASSGTENVAVQDCCLVNPYEGISFVRAHRHLIRNVTGYPIKRGIYVDECYDIGRIENVHFWPFGVHYKPDDPYCYWINTQGVAFELARTDWHYVHNTFCFGYGIGYRFSESPAGSANGNFLGIGADSCQKAVYIEQAQPPGLLITNGEFVGRWSSLDSVCVEIAPGAVGKVSLVNCSFWGPIDRCVWMRSEPGLFSASACHFVQWNVSGKGVAAIDIERGSAVIQGCTFGEDGTHVNIGQRARSAIVMGNLASGGLIVRNAAGRRAKITGNDEDPVEWTAEARAYYRITFGDVGDARWVDKVHGRERLTESGRETTHRWTTASSVLNLPVIPGRAYTLLLTLQVPQAAITPDAGVYQGNRRIIAFTKAGLQTLTGRVEPSSSDTVTLTIRCKSWVPAQVLPGSRDPRQLGVQLKSATMKAMKGAGVRVFDGNTGTYVTGNAR